jgi:hypothetical protein
MNTPIHRAKFKPHHWPHKAIDNYRKLGHKPEILEASVMQRYQTMEAFGTWFNLRSQKILIFFLLKFNMIYTFWIVLMC